MGGAGVFGAEFREAREDRLDELVHCVAGAALEEVAVGHGLLDYLEAGVDYGADRVVG